MTTAATSLLGLALPVTGELSGVWGQTVNDSITTLLDSAVAGTTTLSTDADVTLTTTTLAANQARQAILLCSGARTALRTITAPAQSKIYTVINSTTGGYAVKIVGVGPTTGVTIGSGQSAQVAWNGSDFVQVGASAGGSNTQVQYNNNGALAGSANLTFNGTTLTANALTVTNATTLSGGTANGVAYLNGSKVVTTGSALTFDGTNLGLSSSAVATAIKIDGSGRYKQFETYQSGSREFYFGYDSTSLIGLIYQDNNRPIAFGISGSEQMRLTSTGLGIGTSSPATKFHVVGGITSGLLGASGNYAVTYNPDTSGNAVFWTKSDGYFAIGTGANPYSGGTERLRLDSSGNLGLGVTPSAWSDLKSFDIAEWGSLFGYSNQTGVAGNAYYNAGWKYKAASSNPATRYEQNSAGVHSWHTAPSGTAGNAITFTQAMTLDASGNLGLGTTSPKANSGYATLTLNNATNGGVVQYCQNDTTIGQLFFDGNGGTLRTVSNTSMVFGTNNTERARFTSGGYFKASSTGTYNSSTGSYHELRGSAADTALYVQNTNASSPYGIEIDYTAIDPNGTGNAFLGCYGITTLRAQFRSNGGLANYSANNVNLSDRREKTNFAPAGEYLSKICAIPVQTFNYIDQNLEEDDGLTLGVVAQDVQAVAPELVTESNWGTAEEPKMRLSIYQTDLQYALMKCIQEQQALITQLTERITALESK